MAQRSGWEFGYTALLRVSGALSCTMFLTRRAIWPSTFFVKWAAIRCMFVSVSLKSAFVQDDEALAMRTPQQHDTLSH